MSLMAVCQLLSVVSSGLAFVVLLCRFPGVPWCCLPDVEGLIVGTRSMVLPLVSTTFTFLPLVWWRCSFIGSISLFLGLWF